MRAIQGFLTSRSLIVGERSFSSVSSSSVLAHDYSKEFLAAKVEVTDKEKAKASKFARKQLRAQALSDRLESSSFNIFLSGDLMKTTNEMKLKSTLKGLGFKASRMSTTGLVAASKYYMKEANVVGVKAATNIAKGSLLMLTYEKPITDLFKGDTLAALKKIVPFHEKKEVKLEKELMKQPWNHMRVVGAFVKDSNKRVSNLWLSFTELKGLIDVLQEKTRFLLPTESSGNMISAHALLLSETTGLLNRSLSSIVLPLERSLSTLSQTLESTGNALSHTLNSVAQQKENNEQPKP